MAITVGATTSANNISTSSLAVDKPENLSLGDVLVAKVLFDGNNETFTAPTGFTSIQSDNLSSVSGTLKSEIFVKVADANDVAATDFTFTCSGSGEMAVTLTRVIGAKIIDVQSNGKSNNDSSTITSGGVTPTEANSLIMFFAAADDVNSGDIDSYALTNDDITWTEGFDITHTWAKESMAYGVRTETTATGNATAASISEDNIGQLIALNPIQEISVSDSVTATDSESAIRDINLDISDSVTATDELEAEVKNPVFNTEKNEATWTNLEKN